MKLCNALKFTLLLLLLTSCSQKVEYVVQKEAVPPHIPEELLDPRQVPEKVVDPVQLKEALQLGRALRRDMCFLYAQYIKVLNNASFGEIVLDRATEDRCPSDLTE